MGIKDTVVDLEYKFVINELRTMNKLKNKANIKFTYNSLLYLQMIYHTPKCTVSHIAEKLDIAKSSVTLKINELVKNKLIEKTRDNMDRRVFYISLTEKGNEVIYVFESATNEASREIEENFSNEEINSFCKIMNTYINSYYSKLEGYINNP